MGWRKTPRDLLSNPKIITIANRIEPKLKQSVLSFYVACYMQANDDGVLDMRDREVYADMLFLEKEDDVVTLTEAFIKRGFFEPITDDHELLLITDWENPNQATVLKNGHRIPETQEMRRDRVVKSIGKSKKILENPRMRDKIPENVATQEKIREDKIRLETEERKIREDVEKTHTQERSGGADVCEDKPEPMELCDAFTVPEDDLTMIIKESGIPETSISFLTELKTYDDWQTAGVLYAYFAKESVLPFDTDVPQLKALQKIVSYCVSMQDDKNPAYIIAGQLCNTFNDLRNNKGHFKGSEYNYFKGMQALPGNLLKKSVYPRLVGEVKKKLKPSKQTTNVWLTQVEEYAREVIKDKENCNGGSYIELECQKMNIDFTKPGAYAQYCARLASGKDNE